MATEAGKPASSSPRPRAIKKTLPLSLRLRILMGRWLHGTTNHSNIHPLWGGRLLKTSCLPTEADAMIFVAEHTSIPVPKVHEVYLTPGGRVHIVMDKLPGTAAVSSLREWTKEQQAVFARDLSSCMQQMRSLTPPSPQFVGSVGATAGGKVYDDSLSCEPCGPFDTTDDFHTYLRFGRPLEHWSDVPEVVKVHSQQGRYTSRFSHSDLCPKNILVDPAGRITGVIDWEYAGWYPEYWDYAKMHFLQFNLPNWDKFYVAVDEEPGIHKYPDELLCERVIWTRAGSPFRYCDPPWQPGDDEVDGR